MRISDWSSDVCSSDLPLRADSLPVRRRDQLCLALWRPFRLRRYPRWGPARLRWCRAWYQHPAAPLSDPARRLAGDDWTQGAIPVSALHPILGFAPLTLAGAAAVTFGAAYWRGLTGLGMAVLPVPLPGRVLPPPQAGV